MSTKPQSIGQELRRLYGRRYRVRAGWVEQCYNSNGKWKWMPLTPADGAPEMFSLLGVRHLAPR